MPPFLIEFPADDTERARRFWQGLLQTTLPSRDPEHGRGWQIEHEGIVFGLHECGSGAGFRPISAKRATGLEPATLSLGNPPAAASLS
jgi:hypothetical protein